MDHPGDVACVRHTQLKERIASMDQGCLFMKHLYNGNYSKT